MLVTWFATLQKFIVRSCKKKYYRHPKQKYGYSKKNYVKNLASLKTIKRISLYIVNGASTLTLLQKKSESKKLFK